MAEFPAMPLWTDAYLADTRHLSDAEHGRYLLMLMDMWRSPGCRFPNDRQWLERRFRRPPDTFDEEIQPLLDEFCQCDGNWWTQKKLQKVWQATQERAHKQKGRALNRWDNHDRQRANAATRSARMSEARKKGTHTKAEWEALKAVFGACVSCGTTEYPLEKDHIIPVYQGGSDGIENIQPNCARCNARKGPDNTDRRMHQMPDWIQTFARIVGYIPLKLQEYDACRTPARCMQPEPKHLESESTGETQNPSCEGSGRHPPNGGMTDPTPGNGLSKAKAKAEPHGTRLPEDWEPGRDGIEYARELGLSAEQIRESYGAFMRYWLAKAGQAGRKLRWDLTWQTWVRNDHAKLREQAERDKRWAERRSQAH